MTKTLLIATALLTTSLIAGLCANAKATDLEGHIEYTVVSYTFDSATLQNRFGNDDSKPLMITNSTSDVLTGSLKNEEDIGVGALNPATDIFALSADFIATPEFSVRGVFGVAKDANAVFDHNYESSWEANVGVIYKLFNNISYEVHFGYMETGDLFLEKNSYSDVESIIMISNQLSMSF